MIVNRPFLAVALAVLMGALPLATTTIAAQTQLDLNNEAAAAYQEADRRLSDSYGKLLSRLSPTNKALIEAAQTAWVGFRDSECKFEAGPSNRSSRDMVGYRCLEALTKARLAQIEDLQTCEEGDLACVQKKR